MSEKEAFRGLDWVESAAKDDITVAGCGGIGSWLTFLLSAIVNAIHVYDDDIIESRNLSGQLFSYQQINEIKVFAIKEIINTFKKEHSWVYTHTSKVSTSTSKIIFIGTDNIASRKKIVVNSSNADIIIDGRLGAENFQVFTIADGVEHEGKKLTYGEARELYIDKYCPSDSSIPDAPCTQKQTAFWANGIAWAMIKQYTKWKSATSFNLPMYLPFKIEEDLWS